MKKLIIILLVLILKFSTYAQFPCDIASAGITPSDVQLDPGQTVTITFSLWNAGDTPTCSYGIGQVVSVLSLPPYLEFSAFISPAGGDGDYFVWTYDAVEHVMYGTNDQPIGWQQGDADITFEFRVLTPPSYPSYSPVSLDNETTGVSNWPDNDDYVQPLWINAPMPINLTAFSGRSIDCDHILLDWQTGTEINNDYMEVLRSKDGDNFEAIGSVKGTNLPSGSAYNYVDRYNLRPNAQYFYRLKQVDFDGKVNYHSVIKVGHNCPRTTITTSLFPNPSSELINIAFQGAEADEDIHLNMIDIQGKVVKSFIANTARNNPIEIKDLIPGVYQIVSGENETLDVRMRFIRIE